MKKRKKGFSLIELLAVIIILAILALITIPIVGNLIKQSRINAAIVSAYGYVEATNNEIVSKQTKGEKVEETQYDIKDYNIVSDSMNIKYEGKGPDKGYFNISRSKVSDGVFCINGYEVRYEDGKATYDPEGGYCSAPPAATLCRLKKDLADAGTKYVEETTFYIETADDLYCLSELVNNGTDNFTGKTIILSNDIDMKDINSYSSESIYKTYNEQNEVIFAAFNPIGNSSANSFKGTFSSSNFNTIKNLTINKKDNNYVGLFGYLGSGSLVEEIKLDSLNIVGSSYTGGIVGYQYSGSTIKGIYITGLSSIKGSSISGGIAGYSNGNIYAVQLDNISLTGSNDTGGIAGQLDGIINKALVRGTISGNNNVGGIAGKTAPSSNAQGLINNALVNANISGSNNVGGLLGIPYYQSSNGNNFYGVVEGGNVSGSSYVGKACGITSSYCKGTIYTANKVTSGSGGTDGYSYDLNYHYIGMYDDVLDTIYGGVDDLINYYFDFDSNDNLVLKKANEHSFDRTISGSGTENNPYILATEQDFREIAYGYIPDAYYKISDNIDISNFTHFYNLGTTRHYFTGRLLGNNKTITNMNLNGGQYSGFIGYLNNGSVSNLKITNSKLKNGYGEGSISGILVGQGNKGTISDIEINNIEINKNNGSSWVGSLVGSETGTISNVKVENISVIGTNGIGGFIGQVGSSSPVTGVYLDIRSYTSSGKSYLGSIAGKAESNIGFTTLLLDDISITGTGRYVGALYGYVSNNNIIEIPLGTINIRGVGYTGGIVGYQGSGSTISGLNLSNLVVNGSGSDATGGIAGYAGGNIRYINILSSSITGSNDTGGIVGQLDGIIDEVTMRGTISGNNNVGGIAGKTAPSSNAQGLINNALVNANISGSNYVGGLLGVPYYQSSNKNNFYGVVEGGNVSGSSYVGKACGITSSYCKGTIYTANTVTSGSGGTDGTSYSSNEVGDLTYYGGIKYTSNNTQYPLLDSKYSGDVNNSGWWFKNTSDGKIIISKTTDTTPDTIYNVIPQQPVCTENCGTDVINTETKLGTTCTGDGADITPPTCEFYGMSPLSNGIMASFSCTDDQGAPEVYSMFNSEVQTTYTAQEILDRTGTQKTGTVNGNTRYITSRWTTNYSGNKPEVGRCYYYQYTAVDSCGNSNAYVTNYCTTGFSN